MNSQLLKFPFVLALLCFILVFTSCNKNKRKAEFMLTQYEYGAGDALQYENLTQKYDSCSWEMFSPEGELLKTIGGNNPNLVTGILFPNGIHTLRLNVINSRDNIKSSFEKEFLIKSYRQLLRINGLSTAIGNQDEYEVYIDGQFVGEANSNGAYINSNIPAGSRYIKLVAPDEILEEVYVFSEGSYDPVNIAF
jgi:hypothetical protein